MDAAFAFRHKPKNQLANGILIKLSINYWGARIDFVMFALIICHATINTITTGDVRSGINDLFASILILILILFT